jgi:hypothetical protein
VKLGKLPYRHDDRTLRLARYLTPQLAPPPPSLDLSGKIATWPIYDNDQIGDCTCAAAGHMVELWSAITGKPLTPSQRQVVTMYERVGGYKPGDPSTDNGAVELDVLNWWRHNGLDGYKIEAFALVTPAQNDNVRQALLLFDGVYLGLNLPKTAQPQVGTLWEVPPGGPYLEGAPGTWGGHAVNVVAYDEQAVTVVTWGKLQKMSWPFFNAYCDEAWALLPANWKARAPAGFDFAALEADLAQIGQVQKAPA